MVLSSLTLPSLHRDYALTRCIRSTKMALSALTGAIDSFAPSTVGLSSSSKGLSGPSINAGARDAADLRNEGQEISPTVMPIKDGAGAPRLTTPGARALAWPPTDPD